jgi:hypothetical protein
MLSRLETEAFIMLRRSRIWSGGFVIEPFNGGLKQTALDKIARRSSHILEV